MSEPVILAPGGAGHAANGVRLRLAEMPPHAIAEVARDHLGRPGIVPLWFGESDLETPDFIKRAAAEAMRRGETRYTFNRGVPELRQAIAEHVSGLYARTIGAERVSITVGGMNAIMIATQLLLEPGDNALIVTPLWPNIFSCVTTMAAEARCTVLTMREGAFRLDLDRLMASADSRTRAVFLNSPGNPTGWMMERAEQETLLAFCRARGIWIVADEVYNRLVYDRAVAPSFLEIAEPEDRVISINTFSKSWAMTGWRMGWAVTPASIGDLFGELVQFNTSGVATFVQHAGIAAIREGEPFVRQMVEYCRRGRDVATQRLAALPRVRYAAPKAAFYAFFAVEGARDSLAFAKRIAAEADVGLAPGAAFGPGGEGFLRLCFANSPERLARALDRLEPLLM